MSSITTDTSENVPGAAARPAFLTRYGRAIRGASALAIVLSLFLIMRTLPLERGMDLLTGWIDGLGVWGPVAYGLIYIVASLLLIPGSLLTLASGALFGLGAGTVTVSLASTTAAALSLLIGRYLARDKVARMAADRPFFAAMDRALSQGGWKIVAMLRLSPAVPFGLQNYLYGLTGIRFWPCVLTSWIAMLPGTFMYVYIGALGRAGVAAAATDANSVNLGAWALRIVGFAATVAVTVYVTRLARKALREQTDIEAVAAPADPEAQATGRAARAWTAPAAAALAAVMLTTAVFATLNPAAIPGAVARIFGPPRVTLTEAYERKPDDGIDVDHSRFDRVLKAVVTPDGLVDYEALRRDPADLQAYIVQLAEAPFDQLDRDEKLATLINAYNAFTLQLILDYWPVDSIMDIPARERWDAVRWRIDEQTVSLNQIEHEMIRPNFIEPRIHFAVNCASIGCPPLLREAFVADRLEAQLQTAAEVVHRNGSRWFRFDRDAGTLELTRLYDWYGSDFEQVAGSVVAYAAQFDDALREALAAGEQPSVRYLDYDWSLNRAGALSE